MHTQHVKRHHIPLTRTSIGVAVTVAPMIVCTVGTCTAGNLYSEHSREVCHHTVILLNGRWKSHHLALGPMEVTAQANNQQVTSAGFMGE